MIFQQKYLSAIGNRRGEPERVKQFFTNSKQAKYGAILPVFYLCLRIFS